MTKEEFILQLVLRRVESYSDEFNIPLNVINDYARRKILELSDRVAGELGFAKTVADCIESNDGGYELFNN